MNEELNRRCARDPVTANRVEAELLTFGSGKSGDRDGRLQFHLRRGLRYGDVPGVADLAMLFVGGVPVQCPAACMAKRPTERTRATASNRRAIRLGIKSCRTPARIITSDAPSSAIVPRNNSIC